MEPPGSEDRSDGLTEHLDLWVRHELISRAQAERIRRFESRPATAPPARRLSALSETLAYLGAALAVVAGSILLERVWEDLSVAARVAIPAVLAVALFVLGWRLVPASEPALERLARVAWFLSTGALAWFVGLLVLDALEADGRWAGLAAGAAMAALSAVMYVVRRSVLFQVSFLIGWVMIVAGIFSETDTGTPIGASLAALGVAWTVLGWRRILTPGHATITIGAILTLLGLTPIEPPSGLWLGLAVSSAMIGVGVALRHAPALIIGAVGLFGWTVAAIQYFVGWGSGQALWLLLAGAVLLVLAFGVAKLRPTRWRAGSEDGV